MVLNPGAGGDGLRHAFNQNQGRDPPDAQEVPTPTGLNIEDEKDIQDKAFVRCNTDPNLYNTESGQIPMNMPDIGLTETGSNRVHRVDQDKRINRIKLGDTLTYKGLEGIVVSRSNNYVKLADPETQSVKTVPVSDTYYKSDIIGDGDIQIKMWDMMQRDQRSALLSKAGIINETQKAYLYRDWLEIPEDTREILKLEGTSGGNPGVSHGGVEGREPDFSGRNEESRSFRDAQGPTHITSPYTDKIAPAFRKEEERRGGEKLVKSDVEHGVYGGVVTDTPVDATDEYEDERPKKPLSGAQTAINQGPSGVSGSKRDVKDEPKDPKESEGIHERWSEERKGEQQQAAITGKPDMHKQKVLGSYPSAGQASSGPEAAVKDEDSGVGQSSGGWQGSKPNAQSAEKGEQQQAAITGKPDLRKEEELDKEGGATGKNPSFGDGPIRNKNIVNKNNTRWGTRQASKEEIDAWKEMKKLSY